MRRTRRALFAAVALLFALVVPEVASAHPLGNFTVNHFARVADAGDRVEIQYVLDEAEIPTFQEDASLSADPAGFGQRRAEAIGANLHVTLDGQVLPLQLTSQVLSLPPGAGGLPTLRLEATFVARYPASGSQLQVRDDNDPTRIGWREIVAAPAMGVSDALRQYPEDLLNSPLNIRELAVTVAPAPAADAWQGSTSPADASLGASGSASDGTSVPPVGSSLSPQDSVSVPRGVGPSSEDGSVLGKLSALSAPAANPLLAELANTDALTPAFLVFALGVALVLGAAHALQPGHGKTVVAAYLVGSRGTPRHALFLGMTVTATHTAGVYALGVVTLVLSQYIVPERLYPILEAGSGLLVLGIGVWLLGQRALAALGLRKVAEHHHHGEEDHSSVEDHSLGDGHAVQDHSFGGRHSVGNHSVEDQVHSVGYRRAVQDHSVGERQLAENHFVGDNSVRDGHSSEGHVHSDGDRHSVGQHLHSVRDGQHHHGHGHARVGWRSLLALGVSGGLLPCPEALMVLLITIAAHRVLFGLLLIVAFSTGLASVLVGFGLLLVYARHLFNRTNLSTGFIPKLLPVVSALVIVVAGSLITAQALPQVL